MPIYKVTLWGESSTHETSAEVQAIVPANDISDAVKEVLGMELEAGMKILHSHVEISLVTIKLLEENKQ